jgi:hypothetical protein
MVAYFSCETDENRECFPGCDHKIIVDCTYCSGTGEGQTENTKCHVCHGKGTYITDCSK